MRNIETMKLPRRHQLQPEKTKMHSACIQFCSCDAQQMNTVHDKNVSARSIKVERKQQ